MAATIEVNKQSVQQLLESGKKSLFVIPEYQRPYAWTDEQVETLFDDLVDFTESSINPDNKTASDENYFLGTVVSFENAQHEQEIIDGQQRITTLFLLLRAFYSKLSSMTPTDSTKHLLDLLRSALWQQDRITGQAHFEETLITSRAMGDEGNAIFAKILVTGETNPDNSDNYSVNYRLLQNLIEGYAQSQPANFFELIFHVLQGAILMPISADTEDTALTIFSTLNDRGLALSDADIFKAKIYNQLDVSQKPDFIASWQKLDEDATIADETIQRLFYYYMFYLRAKEADRKSTTPGARKYYAQDKFSRLNDTQLMPNLRIILNFWLAVKRPEMEAVNETWARDAKILQLLDVLTAYPNEFWKYPVITYYLAYHEENDFESRFKSFLEELVAMLCARYVTTPTINAVKQNIMNLNADIIDSETPMFRFGRINEDEFSKKVREPNRKIVRMLLKLLAYQHQDNLLPDHWEIEHILPQKWQSSYFPNQSDDEVRELVEHLGNKMPFEKRLNITAGNGYFARKKASYAQSDIALVHQIADNHVEWGIAEIHERDVRISDSLLKLFKSWGLNQQKDAAPEFLIAIPESSMTGYNQFLSSLGKKDSDELRSKYLKLIEM